MLSAVAKQFNVSTMTAQVSLFRFKLLYFVQFCGYGILSPYMPIFYESLVMTKSQIGILTMLPNVCTFLVGPVFSFIGKYVFLQWIVLLVLNLRLVACAGDKFKAHGEVLLATLVASTLTTVAMLYMTSFTTQLPVVLLTSIFRAPIGPEIDSVVMAALEDKTTYGSLRLWGAVSFGFASLLGGYLTSARPHSQADHPNAINPFVILFYIYAIAGVLSGYIILSLVYEEACAKSQKDRTQLEQQIVKLKALLRRESSAASPGAVAEGTDSVYSPIDATSGTGKAGERANGHSTESSSGHEKARSTSIDSNDSEESASRRNIIATLAAVFHRNPAVLVFAAVVFLSGFGAGAIDSYLFLHLKELGGSGLLMGIARFITCAAEVPMFQIAGSLQKTYGTWPMIALTQMAFVVRFVYYSLLSDPWLVLPCEALNGLTFAVTWSVSCTYANEISPPGCQGVMQALLEGLHFGIGCGVGSLVGGFVYQYYGAIRLFQCCGALSLASTVLALFAWRVCDKAHAPDSTEHDSVHGIASKATTVAAAISIISPRTKPHAQGGGGTGKYLELQQIDEDVAV
jgi:hypothetical protein